MILLRTTVIFFILFTWVANGSSQGVNHSSKTDTTKSGSILFKKNFEKNPADTARHTITNDTSHIQPGEINMVFTPEQDSAYFRALRSRIPAEFRFYLDLKSVPLAMARRMITPGEQKLQVLDFPSEYYTPTGEQMTAQWDNIMRSQYVPFMQTIPSAGIQVPLSAITTFLGLTEDVSPVIKYEIDFSDEVEIVIYSIQARVVRTMFKGNQTPGTYKFTWNGLDDYGRKMLTGDYIGEVRIGKSRYVRKHIQIP